MCGAVSRMLYSVYYSYMHDGGEVGETNWVNIYGLWYLFECVNVIARLGGRYR